MTIKFIGHATKNLLIILFGESFLQNKVKRACFIKRYVYVKDDIPKHMRTSPYYTMSYGKSTIN